MNSDIRIKTSFSTHIKTKKLIKKLGHEGVFALICLWCYAAVNRPKGILSDMDTDCIALASDWHGDSKEFAQGLVDVGFLDLRENCFELHNWKQNNSWVYFADERRKVAKANAEKRWKRPYNKRKKADANGMPTAYSPHTVGNAPSPSPSPSLKDLKTDTLSLGKKPPPDPTIKIFINYAYQTFLATKGKKLHITEGKDGKTIKSLLGTYDIEELKTLWDKFLSSKDEFILKASFSIGVFKTQVNKLLLEKKDWRT